MSNSIALSLHKFEYDKYTRKNVEIRHKTIKAVSLLDNMAEHLIDGYKKDKRKWVHLLQLIRQLTAHLIIVIDDELITNTDIQSLDKNENIYALVSLNLRYFNKISKLKCATALTAVFPSSAWYGVRDAKLVLLYFDLLMSETLINQTAVAGLKVSVSMKAPRT